MISSPCPLPLRLGQMAYIPDSKVHGANMGPIWGRQDPGGPMLAPRTLLSGCCYLLAEDFFHRKHEDYIYVKGGTRVLYKR